MGLLLALLWVGWIVGYFLQKSWSKTAGSSDAWSYQGRPNNVGKIHIVHMGPEIGIMLMLLMSGVWFQEMRPAMFFGILCIIVNHLLLGSHWPLKLWLPKWRPTDLEDRLGPVTGAVLVTASFVLLSIGFQLLAKI